MLKYKSSNNVTVLSFAKFVEEYFLECIIMIWKRS